MIPDQSIHVKNVLGYICRTEGGRDPSSHKGSRPISRRCRPQLRASAWGDAVLDRFLAAAVKAVRRALPLSWPDSCVVAAAAVWAGLPFSPTSKRARPGCGTTASALAAAPVSLCLCLRTRSPASSHRRDRFGARARLRRVIAMVTERSHRDLLDPGWNLRLAAPSGSAARCLVRYAPGHRSGCRWWRCPSQMANSGSMSV
jgi:hypothetical protein